MLAAQAIISGQVPDGRIVVAGGEESMSRVRMSAYIRQNCAHSVFFRVRYRIQLFLSELIRICATFRYFGLSSDRRRIWWAFARIWRASASATCRSRTRCGWTASRTRSITSRWASLVRCVALECVCSSDSAVALQLYPVHTLYRSDLCSAHLILNCSIVLYTCVHCIVYTTLQYSLSLYSREYAYNFTCGHRFFYLPHAG